VADRYRIVGCCSEHVELVKKLKPKGRRAPNVVIISKNGERLVEDKPEEGPLVLKIRS
jgi:hypothetical protein